MVVLDKLCRMLLSYHRLSNLSMLQGSFDLLQTSVTFILTFECKLSTDLFNSMLYFAFKSVQDYWCIYQLDTLSKLSQTIVEMLHVKLFHSWTQIWFFQKRKSKYKTLSVYNFYSSWNHSPILAENLLKFGWKLIETSKNYMLFVYLHIPIW